MRISSTWMAVAAFGLAFAGVARAGEISLISGFYQSETNKVDDNDAGSTSSITLGGRYSQQIEGHLFWFAEGGFTMNSYTKPDGASKGPSDTTSLSLLGGGVRYYFTKLSEAISPFADGAVHYKDTKAATFGAGNFDETEKSGLYYDAVFGIRFNLEKSFFVDISTQLFESALFATEDDNTTDEKTGNQTKQQTKRTELYVNSTGAFANSTVAVGMRF